MRREMLLIAALAASQFALTTECIAADGAQAGRPMQLRYFDGDSATGIAAAVVVPDVPLEHTRQFLPVDEKNAIIGAGDPRRQFDAVLAHLDKVLALSNTRWTRLIKLNIYVARDDFADTVRQSLAALFKGEVKPAVTFVSGKLPHPEALVALDAVAVSSDADVAQPASKPADRQARADSAILPAGPKVYVSGQAERARDLAEATRLTMVSLGKTLDFLQLSFDRVVQVKAFLAPMASVAEAEAEIAKFFPGRVPPLVFVEWRSTLPTEIELIVAGRRTGSTRGEPIEFLTPPDVQASPVFSRVACIDTAESIYTSGLYGRSSDDAAAGTQEMFGSLEKLLDKTGSDFRHLAKATYYVSTEPASTKLNEIRPKFYDPKRPPAASKIMVPGTGLGGHTTALDIIAIRKPGSGR